MIWRISMTLLWDGNAPKRLPRWRRTLARARRGTRFGSQSRRGAAGGMSEVIELRGLRKAFRGHLGIGRTVAVDGLDITVRPGEIFGLLGPNGAGKTTTLKLMLDLLRPDAGEIRLFGRPPSDIEARARVGFLPENP